MYHPFLGLKVIKNTRQIEMFLRCDPLDTITNPLGVTYNRKGRGCHRELFQAQPEEFNNLFKERVAFNDLLKKPKQFNNLFMEPEKFNNLIKQPVEFNNLIEIERFLRCTGVFRS